MKFKNSNISFYFRDKIKHFEFIKDLFKDNRLSRSRNIFASALSLIIVLNVTKQIYERRLETSLLTLKNQTEQLSARIEFKKQQALIPKIETSLKSAGAYNNILKEKECLSHLNGCFLQKIKPQITLTSLNLAPSSNYAIQSFEINFKASFDYEIFDMMEYVLSTHTKFGYTRLREFEIEQLFETAPIVKGRFLYDQLSLNP